MNCICKWGVLLGIGFSQISMASTSVLTKYEELFRERARPLNLKRTHFFADNCANFQGHWTGQCVSRSEGHAVEKSKIVIEQEKCVRVDIDNFAIPVHGFSSMQISPFKQSVDDIAAVVTQSGSWNDSQTKFTATMSGTVPALGLTILDNRSISFDGEVLVIEDGENFLLLNADGSVSPTHLVRQDCRYTRQP